MYTSTKCLNKPIKKNPLFIALGLIFFSINVLAGQGDSTRLFQLIKETQDIFLYPFAHGIFLNPYEIHEHHRDQKIKNIEMVDALRGKNMKNNPFRLIGWKLSVWHIGYCG